MAARILRFSHPAASCLPCLMGLPGYGSGGAGSGGFGTGTRFSPSCRNRDGRAIAWTQRARHVAAMNALRLIPIAAAFLGAPAVAGPGPNECDLRDVKTIGELRTVLSERAVEAVNLAAGPAGAAEARLAQLVTPAAPFSLGAGDVGRPLGTGAAGARAFARDMKADSYRFLGWDYMPTPIEDACAAQKVDIEFIDTTHRYVYPVTFSFEGGRIVNVGGWTRSYQTGPIARIRD